MPRHLENRRRPSPSAIQHGVQFGKRLKTATWLVISRDAAPVCAWHHGLLKLRSRPQAGSAGITVDHDHGVLEGTAAASGRRSIVAAKALKKALASLRSDIMTKR